MRRDKIYMKKEYVGKCYEVVETADQVFIGNDFPAELKGSEDTKRLCGANAKAKWYMLYTTPYL